MTRSMHRKSIPVRLLYVGLMLIILVSFAGVGYAVPGNGRAVGLTSSEGKPGGPPEAPPVEDPAEEVPPVEEPAAEVPPVEEPAAEVPPAEDPPVEGEVPPPAEPEGTVPPEAVADVADVVVAEAAAPVTNPTTPTEGGVVPYYEEGNPSCPGEYKIDAIPSNMTYTGEPLPVGASITISNASAAGFDFSASGIVITRVIVKAANGAYIYDYTPATASDQGLYTVQKVGGGYFDISHVSFCFTEVQEEPGRVFGHKWNDTDYETGDPGDGIWDETEPGLEGWTIQLYRMDETESWVLYATTLTDEDGAYDFTDLPPGYYYVAEVIPLDPVSGEPMWTQSAGPSGEGDEAFTLEPDAEVGPIDFGNWEPFEPFTPGRLFGHKWNDTNYVTGAAGDGIWNTETEPGLVGWTIQLYKMNAEEEWELYATTLTGAGGAYAFEDLPAGDYYVAEVIPLDPVTGDPMWTQSAGPSGVGAGAFEIVDGDVIGPVNFGNWEPYLPYTPPKDSEEDTEEPEPFLPFTGGNALAPAVVMLAAAACGLALRRRTRDMS